MAAIFLIVPNAGLIVYALMAAAFWLLAGAFVAEYATRRGYSWLPIFLCALFLSWPLTLLAVTVAGDRSGPPRAAGRI